MNNPTGKEKYSLRFAKGETKISRILFAVLDVLFIPNFHDVIKSINKKYPGYSFCEKIKLVIRQLDWDRTILGLLLGFLYWFDIITLEMLISLIQGV